MKTIYTEIENYVDTEVFMEDWFMDRIAEKVAEIQKTIPELAEIQDEGWLYGILSESDESRVIDDYIIKMQADVKKELETGTEKAIKILDDIINSMGD